MTCFGQLLNGIIIYFESIGNKMRVQTDLTSPLKAIFYLNLSYGCLAPEYSMVHRFLLTEMFSSDLTYKRNYLCLHTFVPENKPTKFSCEHVIILWNYTKSTPPSWTYEFREEAYQITDFIFLLCGDPQ